VCDELTGGAYGISDGQRWSIRAAIRRACGESRRAALVLPTPLHSQEYRHRSRRCYGSGVMLVGWLDGIESGAGGNRAEEGDEAAPERAAQVGTFRLYAFRWG
jgi:hypothetical protein